LPVITNSTQLISALRTIAAEAIEQVSKDISDNDSIEPEENVGFLQRMIWEKTYNFEYYPNKMYYNGTRNATFQFYRAFKWKKIEWGLMSIKRELFYDWQSMKFDPTTFLHADALGNDMREQLADILNINGTAGRKLREPFWDITINDLFINDGIKGLFDSALNKYMP
jgi:hypothetical protein